VTAAVPVFRIDDDLGFHGPQFKQELKNMLLGSTMHRAKCKSTGQLVLCELLVAFLFGAEHCVRLLDTVAIAEGRSGDGRAASTRGNCQTVHALLQKLKRTPTNRGCRMSSSPIRLWLMRHHDAERERRSRLSFMQWPTAWLWIAVIVAVALLVTIGLAVK